MERSAIRGRCNWMEPFPDYAALHPGYKFVPGEGDEITS
jgi:hypothetical protein